MSEGMRANGAEEKSRRCLDVDCADAGRTARTRVSRSGVSESEASVARRSPGDAAILREGADAAHGAEEHAARAGDGVVLLAATVDGVENHAGDRGGVARAGDLHLVKAGGVDVEGLDVDGDLGLVEDVVRSHRAARRAGAGHRSDEDAGGCPADHRGGCSRGWLITAERRNGGVFPHEKRVDCLAEHRAVDPARSERCIMQLRRRWKAKPPRQPQRGRSRLGSSRASTRAVSTP